MPRHRHAAPIDETAARELDLYAENTSELYGQFKSIIANAAAKRYVKEFGGDVKTMFPKALREHLAAERAREEHDRIVRGEHC